MKIPPSLNIVILILAATAFYTLVGQLVPQKEVPAPEVIEIAKDVSTAEMVEIGKGIAQGKGTCLTCHTIGQSGGALRFPDLAGIGTRAASRIPGMSAVDYLAQSLYEPDVYVVEGFNPGMPVIDKPPIQLTDDEIMAVIAYLQSLGGTPSVTMETKHAYNGGDAAETSAPPSTADTAAEPVSGGGQALFERYGCAECHASTSQIVDGLNREAILASILDPNNISGMSEADRTKKRQAMEQAGVYDKATLQEIQSIVDLLMEQGGEMNILVLLPIVVALVALRLFKVGLLAWIIALWLAIYLTLRYGFTIPIPSSVLGLYMGIATMALVTYIVSSRERWASFTEPLIALIVERRYQGLLIFVVLAMPLLVAASIYNSMTQPLQAPSFARTVHPAPPSEPITVHDEEFDLNAVENPFRDLEKSDPEQFRAHVENGRRVYYQNCVFCHGDDMKGEGLFAHGLNPIPTNFRDSGTIAMFQEGFLFWRIAKGGPGMPDEGGPWESAMPAWENFLTNDEMWEVILFLYDHTDQRPRELEEHGE